MISRSKLKGAAIKGTTCFPNLDEFTITNQAQAQAKRAQLIQAVFGQPTLPTGPTLSGSGAVDTDYSFASSVAAVSYYYHLYGHTGNGQGNANNKKSLFMYFGGHDADSATEKQDMADVLGINYYNGTVTPSADGGKLLTLGYDVLWAHMGGLQHTTGAGLYPATANTYFGHNQAFLSYRNRALLLFLEQVLAAVNYFTPRYNNIIIGGKSGGGWTVSEYGALDARVKRTYSFCGYTPDYLRRYKTTAALWGDYEQCLAYPVTNVSCGDKMILASLNGHKQYYNQQDTVYKMYAGGIDYSAGFKAKVQESAAACGGAFDLTMIDCSTGGNPLYIGGVGHYVPTEVWTPILADLAAMP